MPNHEKHIIVGFIAAAAVFFVVQYFNLLPTEFVPWQWMVMAVVVYIFSQLPDIDQDVSIINKIWNTLAGALAAYVIFNYDSVEPNIRIAGGAAAISVVVLEWIKHRGITHNWLFATAMAIPLWYLNPMFAVVGAAAILSHLLIDGKLTGKRRYRR